MIQLTTSIPSLNFLSSIPNLEVKYDGEALRVELLHIDKGGKQTVILLESLYKDTDGVATVRDIRGLIEPYTNKTLSTSFRFYLKDSNSSKNIDFTVLYSLTEINIGAEDFALNYFLTKMMGDKEVLPNSPEYLHFLAVKPVTVTAELAFWKDGEIKLENKDIATSTGNYELVTLDVSPDKLSTTDTNGELIGYVIKAGDRVARYSVNNDLLVNGPTFLFTNSFGCQEVFVCKGVTEVDQTFKREHGYVNDYFKTVFAEEERIYKAETGVMDEFTAILAEELLRSHEIYLMRGKLPFKEVAIKASNAKKDSYLGSNPSYTLDYRLAQRNHNIMDLKSEGRIFDQTFDKTFN